MYGLLATFHNFRFFFGKHEKPNLDTPQAQAIDGGLAFAVHSLQLPGTLKLTAKVLKNWWLGRLSFILRVCMIFAYFQVLQAVSFREGNVFFRLKNGEKPGETIRLFFSGGYFKGLQKNTTNCDPTLS